MNFEEWWTKDPFGPDTIGKGGVKAASRTAWNAALEAAARAQHPMLRSMISRGQAADNCRALQVEDQFKDAENKGGDRK